MKQVTVFAVATFGGQIIDFQEPIKKKINMSEEQAEDFEESGFTWDKHANYYKTMKRAKASINWALWALSH